MPFPRVARCCARVGPLTAIQVHHYRYWHLVHSRYRYRYFIFALIHTGIIEASRMIHTFIIEASPSLVALTIMDGCQTLGKNISDCLMSLFESSGRPLSEQTTATGTWSPIFGLEENTNLTSRSLIITSE
jgi:hypothetical protein